MSVVVALSLLHFVWQGAAIGVAAWMLMKLARTANARYYVGVAALALMAASPVMTGVVVQSRVSRVQNPSRVQSAELVQSPASVRGSVGLTLDSGRWSPEYIARAIPAVQLSPALAKLLLASWLLGVGLLSVRLSFGLLAARRLTRVLVQRPSVELLANARRLIELLQINRAVAVLESALVQVPTTMGWLKPVVLLPAQAMTGLSIAQIDALVAHELAHIKRHDYIVNLLQSAIETLLFYHPAIWLMSRRVRHERELCCDDMAIAACGDDRVTYASALADLESLRQVSEPMLAANGGSLLTRVKRILRPDDVQTVRGRGHWMAGIAILLMVFVGLASQRIQGRQAVSGVVTGVIQGVTDGVRVGVSGGIKDGVKTGVASGVTDGVVAGVPRGVPDAVVRGISGGVNDAVTAGVPGAIVGGVHETVIENPISTPQIVDDASTNQLPLAIDQVPGDPEIGPFRVGDNIRIEFGRRGDLDWFAVWATVMPNGSVTLQDQPSLRVAGLTSREVAAQLSARYREQQRPLPPIRVTFDDRSDKNKSLFERREPVTFATPISFSSAPEGQSPAAGQFSIQGEVKTPGSYQWESGMTLQRALALAGGLTQQAAVNRTKVMRLDPATGQRAAIQLANDVMKTAIQPGDTIVVPVKYFEPSPTTAEQEKRK